MKGFIIDLAYALIWLAKWLIIISVCLFIIFLIGFLIYFKYFDNSPEITRYHG